MKAIHRPTFAAALIAVLTAAFVWTSTVPASAADYTLQLSGGQQLNPGDSLVSPSGLFLLTMQSDGNLVLYSLGHIAIWASNTAGHSGSVLQMQADGNLVVYAPGHVAIWATKTARGQQPNANLASERTFGGSAAGYWNVDQQMKVEQRAPSTYWAMQWDWAGLNYGGYLGLQTNGNRMDGSTGDTAPLHRSPDRDRRPGCVLGGIGHELGQDEVHPNLHVLLERLVDDGHRDVRAQSTSGSRH